MASPTMRAVKKPRKGRHSAPSPSPSHLPSSPDGPRWVVLGWISFLAAGCLSCPIRYIPRYLPTWYLPPLFPTLTHLLPKSRRTGRLPTLRGSLCLDAPRPSVGNLDKYGNHIADPSKEVPSSVVPCRYPQCMHGARGQGQQPKWGRRYAPDAIWGHMEEKGERKRDRKRGEGPFHKSPPSSMSRHGPGGVSLVARQSTHSFRLRLASVRMDDPLGYSVVSCPDLQSNVTYLPR
ncbi:hypothetical protein LZ32DRAFT_370067 [Colletotrichum eremochloae]|nr:hypothetical protein LZ32DRAFT_370067 [Colletotrichum eremochloae]